MAQPTLGFVYVLTNELMPGIVKIGYTKDLAEDRAKGLFKTGVPTPFEVAFRVRSVFPKHLEQLTHDDLERFRVSRNKQKTIITGKMI